MKKCFLCKSKMELVPLDAEFIRLSEEKKVIVDREVPKHRVEWLIACTNCSYAERYDKNVKENATMS